MGSPALAVTQCTPHPTIMVVLGDRDNLQDNLENEETASEVIDSITEEEVLTEKSELGRLHQLLPSLCIKENVTQLDIILEAIRYIDSLTHKLAVCNGPEDTETMMTEC